MNLVYGKECRHNLFDFCHSINFLQQLQNLTSSLRTWKITQPPHRILSFYLVIIYIKFSITFILPENLNEHLVRNPSTLYLCKISFSTQWWGLDKRAPSVQCHPGQRSFKAIAEWPPGCQKRQEPLAMRKWCRCLVPSRWVNCIVIPLWLYASTNVLVLQRKRTNSIWAERERGREGDWFSVIASQDCGGCQIQNLQLCRVGQQAEDSGNSSSSPKALCWLQNSSLLGGDGGVVCVCVSFCFIKAFSWLGETHQHSGWQSDLLKAHWFKC